MSSLKANFCCNYVLSRLRYTVEMAMLRACKENLCLLSLAPQMQHVLSQRETPCTHRRHDMSAQNCVFFFYKGLVDIPISLGTATSCISATRSNHKRKFLRTDNGIFELCCSHLAIVQYLHQYHSDQYDIEIPQKKTDVYFLSPLNMCFYFLIPLGSDSSCPTLAV